MNVPSDLKLLGMKPPFKLRGKWRAAACKLHERWSNRATFPDLVTFIEQRVKILFDPVFGNIQDTQIPVSKGKALSKSIKKQNPCYSGSCQYI